MARSGDCLAAQEQQIITMTEQSERLSRIADRMVAADAHKKRCFICRCLDHPNKMVQARWHTSTIVDLGHYTCFAGANSDLAGSAAAGMISAEHL